MCHKTLTKLITKLNSNNHCKYGFNVHSNVIYFNPADFDLKHFSTSSRKACVPILNHSISRENITFFRTHNILKPTGIVGSRPYCLKKEPNLPKIMDFPNVVWPSLFKTIRNFILSNFIITRYFDNEFSLQDFTIGSKKAVETVSGLISRGDLDSLKGLVTPEVISLVTESLNSFTLKQRQQFAITVDDIYFCFPYEVGVMFPNEDKNEGENQSRFVEITMCYHALHGLKELRASGVDLTGNLGVLPEYQDKIFILNYRFIREFTKGVQDDWTINALNHFQPSSVK